MFRARLGFALVVTTQRPVVVGTISQACVMSSVFSHVVTRVPDTGGFSPLVQVVITVMKIMTVWGVYFSNITRCEFAIWRCKRRYGHSHSHNTGDCEGEKTLAEFLHNRFLQSERNLYRVCFGTFGFAGGSDFVLSGLFCLGAQTCIGNSHSDEAVKNHKKQAKRRNHATLPRLAVGGNCARANAV